MHGGARAGAGRKRIEKYSYVPHHPREVHGVTRPMHITLRAVRGLSSFRVPDVLILVLLQMRRLNDAIFQIVHFSLQSNHLHLIVEADAGEVVTRKMNSFMSSFARRFNMMTGRRGKVWRERFYCRDITDTRQMHNVLAYVFGNAKKHGVIARDANVYDAYSSAWTFDGFGVDLDLPDERVRWTPPKPRTALLENEWVVHGCVPL